MNNNTNTIIEIFQEITKKFPDIVAIVGTEFSITYDELNKKANKLAYYLTGIGISKDSKVAILTTRSIDMIIAMLAILKSNAVYIPIAVDYPLERIEYIINDTKPDLLIYNLKIKQKAELIKIKNLCIDNNDFNIKEMPQSNPVSKALSDECVYIKYTSGSTGSPKGVMVNNNNIINLISNTNYVSISREDKFLQLSPYDFDGATFEIWGALLNGAQLVLMPAGMPVLKIISDKIETYNISILFITTQLFNSMVESRIESLAKVKQILFGGEVASISHVNQFVKIFSGKLTNVYGPTECTCFSSYYLISNDDTLINNIPIGKPIQNVRLYVFNEHMKHVTESNTGGELYIGGAGVSLGYFNDKNLTIQKFIMNPCSDQFNDILFKTGDIVEIDKNQNIKFIGRKDNQIKIRGFRISLEEIESAIQQYYQVKNVIVTWRANSSSNKLIAHIVTNEGTKLLVSDLRGFLKNKFPSYMIPNFIIQYNNFPLNASGKVDRLQLSLSSSDENNELININSNEQDVKDYLIKQTENDLTEIWRELLKVNNIDIDDDLFYLGGDSLLAIMVLDKCQQHKLNIYLPNLTIADVFNFPTIKLLANRAITNYVLKE